MMKCVLSVHKAATAWVCVESGASAIHGYAVTAVFKRSVIP